MGGIRERRPPVDYFISAFCRGWNVRHKMGVIVNKSWDGGPGRRKAALLPKVQNNPSFSFSPPLSILFARKS